MKYLSLNSYSQSNFKIFNNNGNVFINKYPKKFDGREVNSINKQNLFKSYFLEKFIICSAKIDLNKDNKNFYSMEYFNGKSGANILLNGNVHEINILRKYFYNLFYVKYKKLNFFPIDKDVVYSKISEIENKIRSNKENKLFIREIIPLVKKKLEKIHYYPVEKNCHGDLTLGNIIVNIKEKKIILIDFQKTYNDNIIQDLAKIYQDFELNWTSRYFSSILQTRALIVYNSILNKDFWKNLDKNLKTSLNFEIYITLLRILPYLKENDVITKNWLVKSFNRLL
jgi:hypothetical protein